MSWTRNNNGGSSTLVIEAPATVGSSRTDPTSAPPPPPPPPPPQASDGRASVSRARNTVEMPTGSRPRPPGSSTNGQDYSSYEPPAAIQNAMMTRDKKPFTYTPGMGGKLDLSQIRSPRMARRVAKNANDEGIEAPAVPRTNLTAEPRPVSAGPGLYAQVAVPVFPTNQPTPPLRSTPVNIAPSASVRTPTSPEDPTSAARPNSMPETPTSPQVTLAKAPTPWLQNRSKPREELPEWAKRTGNTGASTPTRPTSGSQQPPSPPSSPPEQQSQARERIIPLRIEDRPSVFAASNETERLGRSAKQPQSQPTTNRHRERWGNNGARPSPETPPSSTSGTYIVPMMVAASNAGGNGNDEEDEINDGYSTGTRVIIQREPPSPRGQLRGEPAPVQSRSFRVLQKITDTDAPVDRTDGQTRQLLLAENDKVLMNKVKERVDGDGVYLHREEDPRYRGAAIPSRAFRYLLNMTDSADRSAATAATPITIATATTTTTTSASPGASAATHVRQPSGDSQRLDQPRRTVAASEQQVPEPKKYTGSAIPSKSFRILQAMTSPENIAARREYGDAVETGAGEGVARPCHLSLANDNPSPSMVDDYRVCASSPLSSALESRLHRLPSASSPIARYSEGNRSSSQLHPSQSPSSLSSSSSSSSLSSSSSSSSLLSSSSLTTSSRTDGSAANDRSSPIPHPIYRSSLYEMSGANRRHYHHLHYRRNRSRRQREANNPDSRRSRNDELPYVSSPAIVEQTPTTHAPAPTTDARRRPTEKRLGHDGNCVPCLESRVLRVSDIAADSGIDGQQWPDNGSTVEAEPPPRPPWHARPSKENAREDFEIVGLGTRNEPGWNRIDIATTRERTAAYDLSIPMNISTPLVNAEAIAPVDDTSEEANEDSSSLTDDDSSQTTDEDEDDSDSYVAYSTGPCLEHTGETPSENGGDKVKDTRVRGGGASPNEIGSDGWKCESSSDESVAECELGSNFRVESNGDAAWSTESGKSIDAQNDTSPEVSAAIETMSISVAEDGADVAGKDGQLKVGDIDEEEKTEDEEGEEEEEDAEEENEEEEVKESEITLDSNRPPTTRKINGYKRTQTHSRLFRLLSNPRDREPINGQESQTPSVEQTNKHRLIDYSRITAKKVPAPLTAAPKVSTNYPYEEVKRDVSERIMDGPLPDWRFGRRVKCPRIDDRKNVPGVPNGRWNDRALIGTGNTDGSDTQQCLLSQFSRDLLLSCEHSPIGKPRYHRAGAKRT